MTTTITASTKKKSKAQEEFYLPKDAPLLVIVVENAKAGKELKKLTSGLKNLPLNYRVLLMKDAAKKDIKVSNSYSVSKEEAAKFFTFAHMVLFLSEKPSEDLVKFAIENESVPIVYDNTPYLKNYTGPTERGNCFKFKELNSWSMYASVVRALENFGFPYDWKNIISSAKEIL